MARMSFDKAKLLLDMNIGNGTIESAAWEVVRAHIKEAQPTVRAKRPAQQLYAKITRPKCLSKRACEFKKDIKRAYLVCSNICACSYKGE